MISPEQPGPVEDKKKTPPRDKQDGDKKECDCGKDHSHYPEEEGVDTANDFMRKFLKKSEG
jgi:hypothetical protein